MLRQSTRGALIFMVRHPCGCWGFYLMFLWSFYVNGVEGRAGETLCKELINSTELHPIVRLHTGIFYTQGVRANVNHPASTNAWTNVVWVYD